MLGRRGTCNLDAIRSMGSWSVKFQGREEEKNGHRASTNLHEIELFVRKSLTKRWMNVEMSSIGRKINNTGKVEVSSTREKQMTSI